MIIFSAGPYIKSMYNGVGLLAKLVIRERLKTPLRSV